MDAPPKIKTVISLFCIFSLKKITPQIIESKITPILSVGKNIALSSNPASDVFSKLQQPKNRPTQDATASLRGQMEFAVVFFVNKANNKEIPVASKNAMSRKTDFCSAYADFCCSFCTIPKPPEASIAITRGIK